ncbi:PP2C family protein-serine/threonine phosphatase [Parabacteroides sp. ZJ-118]|uniref:PP2C family protein-serine/threonine phosphatase n=1 Tax=Parabacteroides sp. ZJ-118 TaxID=2709398 RepID=UPI0013ECB049|nr:SpoIIE family protein phosphatase [Parabacteroides sp. ZJ-118]
MAIKILSVDDEQDLEVLLTHYFRRKIRKGEYEFTFAHNGLEALKLMVENPDFDIILSDINMPEMDGLTLLSKINELRNPAQKCIMVSAYGDMKNIRTAMNRGAFDFATKPIDLDDLSTTIEKAVEQIKYIKETQKEHYQLQSLQTDLATAGEIQKAILPCKFPPFPELEKRLDIYASMTPAKDIGGDFYDFFRINEDKIGFVMADVSGKGIPAALFMAVSNTLLRSVAMSAETTNECMNEVNRLLCKASVNSMFVTMLYGILNHKTGDIDFTNAGHNPSYILRDNGTVEQVPQHTNFVAGGLEGFVYKNDSAHLNPGEAIVLYTDGITEAFNTKNEAFGEERLADSLAELYYEDSKTIIEEVHNDLGDFIGDTTQSDDMTMLVIKRKKN